MKLAVCSHCGSDQVLADAFAAWDVKTQQWELTQTFDKGAFCEKCDGETSIDWVAIKPLTQPTLFDFEHDSPA